jgi:hypothetical protein
MLTMLFLLYSSMRDAATAAKVATALGTCHWALLTSPSSGQATDNSLLRHLKLPACHSGAALE